MARNMIFKSQLGGSGANTPLGRDVMAINDAMREISRIFGEGTNEYETAKKAFYDAFGTTKPKSRIPFTASTSESALKTYDIDKIKKLHERLKQGGDLNPKNMVEMYKKEGFNNKTEIRIAAQFLETSRQHFGEIYKDIKSNYRNQKEWALSEDFELWQSLGNGKTENTKEEQLVLMRKIVNRYRKYKNKTKSKPKTKKTERVTPEQRREMERKNDIYNNRGRRR